MNREDASDLLAFLAVARERNFTRAAAKLGMTQSALSQIIRSLEERIGVRLLNRTTRSVTPTQAGERLFLSLGPKFNDMDADLAALRACLQLVEFYARTDPNQTENMTRR
jgi:DNA-binding transcriptional LysR family regulator